MRYLNLKIEKYQAAAGRGQNPVVIPIQKVDQQTSVMSPMSLDFAHKHHQLKAIEPTANYRPGSQLSSAELSDTFNNFDSLVFDQFEVSSPSEIIKPNYNYAGPSAPDEVANMGSDHNVKSLASPSKENAKAGAAASGGVTMPRRLQMPHRGSIHKSSATKLPERNSAM